ncbi:MAG: hypothetical protein HYY18_13320 [Planctomycetes bacterium]|nr:hypothetical protein [Planctomycetota bacterium]
MKRNHHRTRRGYALLLVIVVSVALMAIAIPFAISMKHQEKGAQGTNDRAQARYSALAGRNHALAGALRGHETAEENPNARAPFNTPYVDSFAEYAVDWSSGRTAGGDGTMAVSLRGALMQDEQSKVNLRTAPVEVTDRVRARVDARTHELRDYVTEHSGRPCAWVAPQHVRAVVPVSAGLDVFVDDPTSYGEGTKVRVTSTGLPAYGMVTAVNPNGSEFTVEGIPESASDVGALIEAECRHPININTASAVVLAACLEGLALRGKITEDQMTRQEADNLAAAMIKVTFVDMVQFMKFLAEQRGLNTISQNDETAILVNFTNPNSRRLAGTGTVPFVFQSYDYVTVAAHGVQDLPSGAIGAQCDLRQIVEIAPAGTLRWRCRSQYDFERELRLPLGSRVITWPACVAAREAPLSDRSAPAWVTTTTGRDERASWKITNHFDPWHNGTKMAGNALPQRAGQILQIAPGNVDIEAGSAEMWLKTSSTLFTVMDAGSEEWSNRIYVSYGFDSIQGANVLKLILKDSSLEHTYAQITHPVTLTPDTWYHIGAFWKGTKFGQAKLMIDGLPVGTYGVWTEAGQNRHVTLASALVPTDVTVQLTGSLAGFPATGAVEIGNEAIEYAAISGSSLTGCLRGARGTSAQDHQAGVGVTIWGYMDRLIRGTLTITAGGITLPSMVWDRLTTGGGNLVEGFGATTMTYLGSGPPGGGGPPPVVLTVGASSMDVYPAGTGGPPVASDPMVDFPSRGWLSIGGREVVSYTGRTATQFTGLTRGLFGTMDANHFQGEQVSLWGFYVTDNTNYLTPTVIAIGDEWLGPVVKEGTDAWRGTTFTLGGLTFAFPLARGALGTNPSAHAAGDAVLPTFALADASAGDDDVITFVEQDPATREEHTISHAMWAPALLSATASPNFLIVSLTSNVAKEWVPDNFWVRVLKFPSGELMGINQNLMTFGGSANTFVSPPLIGWIDELRLTNGPKNLQFQISLPIDAVATTVPILAVSGMDAEGGAIIVGNEMIGYAGIDAANNTLINCTRGYLGTLATPHDTGARVFNMAFLAIAALTAGIAESDKTIPIVANGFPQEGYLLVDQELVGYTFISQTGPSMPPTCDFRGAFGTPKASHNVNALAYAFPFRYYDRFTAMCDDPQAAWFGASFRATGATWRRVTYEERLPNNSVDIRVNLRFNAQPRWTMPPNNKPFANGRGGVWQFSAPNGGTLTGAWGDQVEAKIEFVWNDDAYTKGEWKESPEFRGITVEYEQEPVIHVHEEK